MKKIILIAISLCSINAIAQFNIHIKTPNISNGKEAYIYTLDGSKDILYTKEKVKNGMLNVSYNTPYKGMMKVFFPEYNFTLPFISENSSIDIDIILQNNKIPNIIYKDETNALMDKLQRISNKQEHILPALHQMMNHYYPNDEFYNALDKEIKLLSQEIHIDNNKFPFIDYYQNTSKKFLQKSDASSNVSQNEIVSFITNSNELLESSGLIRPLLLEYLKNTSKSNTEEAISQLLNSVNLETSRGQTVLSELIDIFSAYSINDLKEKYLKEAQGLKCSINSRLSNTISTNKNIEIGAKLQDSALKNTINSTAKSIHDIKAEHKIIVFWSSGCSHCTRELPKFIPYYSQLKSKKIEIIGLSLDNNKSEYEEKAKNLPWINASELNGWYSSYAQKYNVMATPNYFILDSNNKIVAKPNSVEDVIEFLGVK